MKLALKTRSIGSLGVREIGREAGLNPNTFYRHFSSLEDLGVAMLNEIMGNLRAPLRDLRRRAAETVAAEIPSVSDPKEYWAICLKRAKLVAREAISLYFDFIIKNPEAFTIGVSEMSGSSSVLRKKIQEAVDEFAKDLSDDIRILQLLPMLSDEIVHEISVVIIRQIFMLSTDYIDAPDNREQMQEDTYGLMLNLVAGAIAMEVTDIPTMAELIGILRAAD